MEPDDLGNGSSISQITAETDDNVITSRNDRYVLSFVAEDTLGGDLDGGDKVSVTLTTAAGASTVTELRVPDSLVSRSAVSL